MWLRAYDKTGNKKVGSYPACDELRPSGDRFSGRKDLKHSIKSLLTAALAIPGIRASTPALAQDMPTETTLRAEYLNYREYQHGGHGRMRVNNPTIWLRSPLAESTELEGSFAIDSVSGASPLYLSTLSGASGKGIRDKRLAGDFKLTQHFSNFSLGVGGVLSNEDDYKSRGALLESKIWTPDKNTTFAFSIAGNNDAISSTNNVFLDDSRKTRSTAFGVTQVINRRSIIQSNLTYSNGQGYFTDPYKFYDNRPRSREQWAWLNRYNLYLVNIEASLHFDYRYYFDTWDLESHMFEIALHKPINEKWAVKPSIRYYSQNAAEFFTSELPPENFDRHITGDSRLSSFGGLTTGFQVFREMGNGFSADIKVDFLQQRPSFRLGGPGSSHIEPFYAVFFTVGITKRFQ